MNSFEVITKYLPQAVDKYFAQDSKTAILENGSKFIDVNFNEAGYVKIADFLLDGLSDYYKTQESPRPASPAGYAAYAGNLGSGERDGFDIGGVSVSWEIFKLQWCRGRQFRIDHISNEETGKIVTGGLIEEFHRLKVIPEVDACRFSVIADSAAATLGNLIQETLDPTNAQTSGAYINSLDGSTGIIHHFNAAFEWLSERAVPEELQIIFVCPTIMTMIRNSKELTKFITQSDYRSGDGLTFSVEKYMGRPIIEVTSDRFFTDVVTTRNGYQASASSRQINFMVVSAKAVVPIRKIEYSKVYGEDMTGLAGFYGTMMNYLLYHGVVVPKNKVVGVYLSVGASGTAVSKTNVLYVDVREGSVSGSSLMNNWYTLPQGLRGTLVYSESAAFTVGSAVTIGSPVFAVGKGEQFSTTGTSVYFGLVDARGICIASSGSTAITIPQKA